MMGIGGNHPQVVQLIPDLSENGLKNKNKPKLVGGLEHEFYFSISWEQ